MGLIGWVMKVLSLPLETQPPPRGVTYGGENGWDGPDDLWPDEIATTQSEPELIVTQQYGLALPNGDIVWNAWTSPLIPFDNPLDRLRMVANLQKTAADLGFEVEDFLGCYGWVTRNQIATVVYEDTGAYGLTDPDVCGAKAGASEDGGLGS